ncbi:hypothetical protein JTE90_017311 [Oedothorax gibbosus]|uniref:EF-hand domain-containing protein n=1 Tax=Oedothorax gibbosus TaxID=931172 RepID=A0AAV6UEB7_9ARAC|nr:hypothetical protein JTE90_017311 [Oedothorax gibbosus]
MSVQLQHFFKTFDPEGTKSVDREAFRDLCSRLNIANDDADVIFEDLDLDLDGRISFTDFSRGFSNFMSTADEANVAQAQASAMEAEESSEEATKHHVWTTLTNEAEKVGKNSDEGKLKWLLNELHMSEQRHLVPYLETAVEELQGNLLQLQDEKARLEDAWHREKFEHEKHLKRMEEELDNQVKEAELKMRLKAQEEVEDERKTLQTRMDTELDKLQSHLVLVEKVYSWLRTQPTEHRDVRLDEVKTKLDEAVHDNRQLRMSLLDTQTSIALMRSEFLQLRTMYEEKCRELSSERERILEVLQEQDHLSRQINLLHDANKRLLDSHDAMKTSVESPAKPSRLARAKSGSIIGDYLEVGHAHDIFNRYQEDDYEDIEVDSLNRRPKSMDSSYSIRRRPKANDRQSARSSLNHSDSGVSTVRDSAEVDENWVDDQPRPSVESEDEEPIYATVSRRDRTRRDSCHSRASRPTSMPPTGKMMRGDSYREFELRASNSQDSLVAQEPVPKKRISDIKKQLGFEDKPANWNRSFSSYQCSTPKDRTSSESSSGFPPVPMPRISKINSIYESIDIHDGASDVGAPDLHTDSMEEDQLYEPTGQPEKTFKVIFVGDAGVGKSSFALRISKGVFVRHMSSTLGLDFLMRNLRVDGRNVAVQLWDTAGQERFRSITKTYFRKADGVMLLYDCTCEHSFLNVRSWVEDIDSSSAKRIPLMIVANKTDLREMARKTGTNCISKEQGEKLARDCDTTFMEASAKDGSNVLHSLANLIRCMATHQDLQMSASALQLSDTKAKKSSCCGK